MTESIEGEGEVGQKMLSDDMIMPGGGGINRCPHIIAINQKYFSNKAQDFSESSEYLFLSSFFVTR